MIAYAQLAINVAIKEIQQEVKALLAGQEWQPHFNIRHYEGVWSVLSLRAPGGDTNNPFAETLGKAAFQDTALMKSLPAIQQLTEQLDCDKQSVRLLNLQTGSEIKTHRDFDLAFEKGEARLHFPIFTNPLVEFHINEEPLKMQEGECWYINANLPHRAANMGAANRIHLVVDCLVNDWLKQQFELAQKKVIQPTKDRELQLAIIKNLRLQNTPTALELARKLESEL